MSIRLGPVMHMFDDTLLVCDPECQGLIVSTVSLMPVAWATGGYSVEHGTHIPTGQWSEWETEQSYTWHKLKAVWFLLPVRE